MILTRFQSFAAFLVSVVFFTGIGFGTTLLVMTGPVRLVAPFPIVMGVLFGFMGWAAITIPDTPPNNNGWRRFRPIMWFAAFFAFLDTWFFFRFYNDTIWQDMQVAAFMATFFTVIGWGMLYLRADRTRYILSNERTKFLAKAK